MAIFKARTFQTVGSSGFSNAKKLADLTIKRSENSDLMGGYEKAAQILSQFQYSGKESEALDAQRLIQGYSNKVAKLKAKKSEINKTVGEFKINEREAFYITPTTQFRSNTMFDIPTVVSDTTAELRQIVFAVSNAIDEKKMKGDSSADLEGYYFQLYNRYRMMEGLNNDLLNGEISQNKALKGFGVFVDANQNDGQVFGISVAPIGDLPQGLSSKNYKQTESSVNYGGGDIPVFSRFSTNQYGEINARIGSRVWSGDANFALRFDSTQSNDSNYKDTPGSLNLSDFAPKQSTPIRPGQFFKGFTGFDSNGTPQQTMFFTSKEGKIYSVDSKAQGMLQKDFNNEINNAVGVDSGFAQGVLKSGDVTPLNFTPMLQQPTIPTQQATQPTQQPTQSTQQQASFFNQPTNKQNPENNNLKQNFFNRTNKPNTPQDAVGISSSPSDIIDKGKSFFRGVKSFFNSQ